MTGISSTSNTATLLEIINIIDALVNAEEVQTKLLQALDTHEMVKALNRMTGSHENLSPKLLEALEASRKFCYATQAETLASVVLEKCQDSIMECADANLETAVLETLSESLQKCIEEEGDEDLMKAAKTLAETHLLLDLSRQIRPEAIETPPESLLKEQLTHCTELLETILSPP